MTLEEFKAAVDMMPAEHKTRVRALGENYGEALCYDLVNVLLHARDQDKMEEVLGILEAHYEKHLQFQHPDIRGQVSNVGGNPTKRMFLSICQDILGLEPSS